MAAACFGSGAHCASSWHNFLHWLVRFSARIVLQALTSEYGDKVQRMRELRASRADRTTAGVAYSVGQVFR